MHGRLLITGVRGSGPGDPQFESDLEECVRAGVGGVILFDVDVPTLNGRDPLDAPRNILDPDQVSGLTAHIRDQLGPDAWIGIDQEGGRVARLNERRGFEPDPAAAEFARMDRAGREDAARALASRLAHLGFDFNFAPCVDLALNPANPVIAGAGRCLGTSAAEVIEAASVLLDAHVEAGVAACLKHFPGHGSSVGDTHGEVVDITATWKDDELEPYRKLASRRGLAVMAAHVIHRGMDPELPASLSPRILDGFLRQHLGFDGVVVTDSIDMRAIADAWNAEEAAVMAIRAGADLVVDGFNLTHRREHPARAIVASLTTAIDDARLEGSLARIERLRAEIGRA